MHYALRSEIPKRWKYDLLTCKLELSSLTICILAYVGGDKYKYRSSYITTDITPLSKDFNRVGSLKSSTQKSFSSSDGNESNLRRNSYENSRARENGVPAVHSTSSIHLNHDATDATVSNHFDGTDLETKIENHYNHDSAKPATSEPSTITPTSYTPHMPSSVPEVAPASDLEGHTRIVEVETIKEEPAYNVTTTHAELAVESIAANGYATEVRVDDSDKRDFEYDEKSGAESSLIVEESVEVSDATTTESSHTFTPASPQRVIHGPASVLDDPIKPFFFLEKLKPLPQDVEQTHLPPLAPEPNLDEQESLPPDDASVKGVANVSEETFVEEIPSTSEEVAELKKPRDESPPRRTSSGRPAFEASTEASRAELIKSFGYTIGDDGEAANKSSKKLFMM